MASVGDCLARARGRTSVALLPASDSVSKVSKNCMVTSAV